MEVRYRGRVGRQMTRIVLCLCAALLVCAAVWTVPGACAEDGSSAKRVGPAISPPLARVATDSEVRFVVEVAGEPAEPVKWLVNGVPGGNETFGTIAGGVYHSPAVAPTPNEVHVEARLAEGGRRLFSTVIVGGHDPAYRLVWRWETGGQAEGRLEETHGICLDQSGNVILTDPTLDRVCRYTPEGKFLDEIGSGKGAGPGFFDGPRDAKVDPKGRVYVIDGSSNTLQRFDPDGKIVVSKSVAEGGKTDLNRPHSLDIDASAGRIYVADTDNKRVAVFDEDCNFLMDWPTPLKEKVAPTGVGVDPNGDVFVVDYNGVCYKYTGTGELLFSFAVTKGLYHGIYMDKWGDVYLAAGGMQRGGVYMDKFNNNGVHVLSIEIQRGGTLARTCVAVDTAGNLYAAGAKGIEILAPTSTEDFDTVSTRMDDRLHGRVVGIDGGGTLRLSGLQFEGEVLVATSALARVTLAGKHEESGRDEVVISNGDRIMGELTAITPDAVVIESGAAGALKIPRNVVSSIAFGGGSGVLVDSHFEGGRMEPWKSRGGSWSFSDGVLNCRTGGNHATLSCPLEQKEAVTIVAKVKALAGSQIYCYLVLFCDVQDGNYYGRNSVFARFRGNSYRLQQASNGGTNTIISQNLDRSVQEGVLRMAYDPQSGKATLWLDSTELGAWEVPNKLESGSHVAFDAQQDCSISHVRVLRGVVPPSDDAGAQEDSDTVRLANQDRISATSLTLADGLFVAQGTYGELSCPVERLSTIIFRTKGREEPRRRKGDVKVETPGSSLTLELKELTGEHLVGNSDYLGEVTMLRGAVRGIQFNLYESLIPLPAAGSREQPEGPTMHW